MPEGKRLLEAGVIAAAHGVHGEVKLNCCTDCPDFLLDQRELYLADGTPLRVLAARVHKGCLLLRLRGVDDMDAAMRLLGVRLYFDKDKKKLPEGRYYIDDLVGLRVVDCDTGEEYGTLEEVSQTGANDIYGVRSAGGKLNWFPAIKEVVICCDIAGGTLHVRPLPGLLEL